MFIVKLLTYYIIYVQIIIASSKNTLSVDEKITLNIITDGCEIKESNIDKRIRHSLFLLMLLLTKLLILLFFSFLTKKVTERYYCPYKECCQVGYPLMAIFFHMRKIHKCNNAPRSLKGYHSDNLPVVVKSTSGKVVHLDNGNLLLFFSFLFCIFIESI